MNSITLPRLKLTELQSLTESTLQKCSAVSELQLALTSVQTVFNTFKQGMLNEQSSAADKKAQEYISDTVSASELDSAATLAPKVEKALEALFALVYSLCLVNENSELLTLHIELSQLVDTYR